MGPVPAEPDFWGQTYDIDGREGTHETEGTTEVQKIKCYQIDTLPSLPHFFSHARSNRQRVEPVSSELLLGRGGGV